MAKGSPKSGFNTKIAAFYQLTKPGIIYGNIMTTVAGFLFASHWHGKLSIFVPLLVGNALIIASACVFNNYIDRDIDHKMARTKARALVTGEIPERTAIIYATILGIVGFAALLRTNLLTVAIGAAAFVSYIVLYGIAKRRSPYGTLVGTLPGAASLAAGYTAVSNRFDLAALLLVMIMVAWQMSHFYAIAIRRLKDYTEAGLPVWPAKYGITNTKRQIILFILLFMVANVLLTVGGYVGITYAVVMTLVGLAWLQRAIRGFKAEDDTLWAKRTFLFSLIVLMALCVMLPLGVLLP